MPRAGLTRQAVTAAALQVIDSRRADGFATLTLASVAAEVGVAVPSLYKHVASLADLKREVAVVAVRDLTANLSAAAIGRSGADALRALARATRTFARSHPARYAAAQVAPHQEDPSDAELRRSAADAVTVVEAVLRGYGLSPGRVVDAVRVVRSAFHGFVMLELGGGFGLPDDVDRSFEALVETVDAGIRSMTATSGASV